MDKYKINKECIIGQPSCGWGFESSKMCFIACPADDDVEFEIEIISDILSKRNYEAYVAQKNIDPAKMAFCTKICSKIITSHLCIVLLNQSVHKDNPNIKIPNPNVHLEYGMMLGFHKHIIPIQKESEKLAFNIYPFDTIKYKKGDFKTKTEDVIDDIIIRFSTKEPPGRPIGKDSNILKFFSFRGMQYSNVNIDPARWLFSLGNMHGFNLFDGIKGFIFFGYFLEDDLKEIVLRIKFLMQNIVLAFGKINWTLDLEKREGLNGASIEILVSEDTDTDRIKEIVRKFEPTKFEIPTTIFRPSEIEKFIEKEYKEIGLS